MVVLYIKNEIDEFIKIPLYDDENIFYENKLTSGEEIGSIFNDSTNSFTIPADDITNELFKDIYEIGRFDSFNVNKRADAYTEFNTIPFRFGEVQLESFQKKNGQIDNYKITFYGNLLQLDDLFGEDKLSDLFEEEDVFDIKWDSNNISFLLSLPFLAQNRFNNSLQSEVYIPLCVVKPEGVESDITTTEGALTPTELRPAIRTRNIIDRIISRYNISFISSFFDKPQFQNLYTWLNGNKGIFTDANLINNLPAPNFLQQGEVGSLTITDNTIFNVNVSNSYIQAYAGDINEIHRLSTNFFFRGFTVDNTSVPYKIRIKDGNDNIVVETDTFIGNQTFGVGSPLLSPNNRLIKRINFRPINFFDNLTEQYKLEVLADGELELDVEYDFAVVYVRPNLLPNAVPFRIQNTVTVNTTPILSIKNNIPDISVKDFLVNILKQNNLIIRPKSQREFIIENITDYYSSGNTINITPFIDLEDIQAQREELNKTITFKYEESNQEANQLLGGNVGNFTKVFDIDSKEEDEIELDFEYPLFVPLINPVDPQEGNTELNIALYNELPDNVINFYYNGIVEVDPNEDFRVQFNYFGNMFDFGFISLSDTSDSQVINQVSNDLNFNPNGFNYFHGGFISNLGYKNLYVNYWEEYLNALYRNDHMLINFKSYIDWEIIDKLELNSEIIINNEKYLIYDYKINLINGETEFTLFPTYINKFEFIENNLSISNINFNAGGGYTSFTVNTNSTFNIQVSGVDTSWVEVNITEGKGTTEIPVRIIPSIISNSREAVIEVNIDGTIYPINVRQDSY